MKDYLNIYNLPRKAYHFITSGNNEVCSDICTFDIETTTFFKRGNFYLSEQEIINTNKPAVLNDETIKQWGEVCEREMQESEAGAVAYLWQFGINNNFFYGRELTDFVSLLDFLATKNIRLKIFVHNLSYEYFFLRGVMNFNKVFFTDRRAVLYAEYNGHLFACTYKLTNLSLRMWGKQNGIAKLDTLDYGAKIRTPKTRLDKKELEYGSRDIEVMHIGLKSYVDIYGDVWNIPLTQTGTLRRDIKHTKSKDVYYHNMLVNMLPKCADDLKFLRKTFSGAIVISNPQNTNRVLKRLWSYDKTSAYPFVLCVKKFPVTEFTIADTKYDILNDDGNHHLYQIRFYGLESLTAIHTLPSSKRIAAQNMKLDNGKVISADVYECFMCEIDIKTFFLVYKCKRYEIIVHKIAKSDYLDKDLVLLFLDYYAKKTTLKGVEGMEVFYLRGKEKMNAGYGCCATNPVKGEIVVDGYDAPTIDETTLQDSFVTNKLLEKYSKKWGELVAFAWGIYVTAWERYLLVQMIIKLAPRDFVYSDTDCIKGFLSKYQKMFNEENIRITNEIKELCDVRGIDFELFQPADINGKKHLLGLWDFEGIYPEFKTLGQKRYAFKKYKKGSKTLVDDKIYMVVSGVPKTAPAPATLDGFKDGLSWDIFTSNKKLVQYKDGNNLQVTLNKGKYDEYKVTNPCAVTIRSMSYNISLTREYKELLQYYLNKKR